MTSFAIGRNLSRPVASPHQVPYLVLMPDPFFETIYDGQWNACVGVQGSEINYVDGYLEAASLLADTLIEQELMGSRDTLAMPILYNARHGLELALKYAASQLARLGLAPRRQGTADHHIFSYWRSLEDANIADEGTRAAIAALEPYVRSLARIDDDGQELRFHETINGKRSLDGIAVVNLPHIRASIATMAEIISALTHRISILQEEQHTGTHTTRCSRSDLTEIVRVLGPHRSWRDLSFDARRGEAMDRFGLSKKGLSNAIDVIRGSRDLAGRLGIETPLAHTRDEQLLSLAERWLAVYPPPALDFEPTVIYAADTGLENIERYHRDVQALVAAAEGAFSLEEFADVETTFYIGRNRQFGEDYARDLERTIAEHRLEPRRATKLRHVLSKLNFLEGLADGLERVGRPSLATRLRDMRDAARPPSVKLDKSSADLT